MSAKTTGIRRCKATTSSGVPCKANVVATSQYCFFHDPGRSAQRHAARRAGGLQRSGKAAVLPQDFPDQSLKNPADIMNLVEKVINCVLRGELDPRVANCAGYLAAQMLKAYNEVNLEGRVASLEAAAEKVLKITPDLQEP